MAPANQDRLIFFENIPKEMHWFNQWICWQYKDRGELKPAKLPINPRTGKLASVTNPDDWGSFREAVVASVNYCGIGFVFTKNDPYCGIDLDDTHGDSVEYERQLRIYNAFQSYTELSPGGRGVHIIIKAKLPGKGRRRGSIEIYDDARFFTMTGNIYRG